LLFVAVSQSVTCGFVFGVDDLLSGIGWLVFFFLLELLVLWNAKEISRSITFCRIDFRQGRKEPETRES
jgi:hypothetical protein